MKKLFKVGVLVFCMALLGGCGTKSQFVEEEITDANVLESLNESAIENVNKYFGITVDQSVEMEIKAVKNVPVEKYADTLPETIVFTAQRKEDPKEGDLYSYAVMQDDETKELKGMFISVYSEKEAKEYTEDELKQIVETFIKEKSLAKEGEAITFEKMQDYNGAKYIKSLIYTCGDTPVLLNVNLQDGQVMSFECALQKVK